MTLRYNPALLRDFPTLVAGSICVAGITPTGRVAAWVDDFLAVASGRLAGVKESDLPEIRAWRRVFSQMGWPPTRYRCAAEALLRRYRREARLPVIHPLVDLCNAASLAFAIPIAAFDLAQIDGQLEVRRAAGDEVYLTFDGKREHPLPGEVIFADASGQAHARRWTYRQSAASAVRWETTSALIVAEALHDNAAADVRRLMRALCASLAAGWPAAAVKWCRVR